MKDNREFDHIIRGKMKGLEPSLTPESWDFLEQKMDAAEAASGEFIAENDAIDQLSYDKLHNLNQPFNKTHWELMAGKLEREFYFIQELFRMKTMEAALMLLLLLTIGRFIPGSSNQHLPQKATQQNGPVAELQEDNSQTQEKISVAEWTENTDLTGSENGNAAVNAFSNDIVDLNASNEKRALSSVPGELTKQAIQTLTTPAFAFYGVESMKFNNIELFNNSKNFFEEALFPAAPGIASNALALLTPKDHLLGYDKLKAPLPNIIIRVGMYGSPNIDHIINPAGQIGDQEIPSLNRYELGYTGGVSLGIGIDRFEVETGLAYTSKRYEPFEVQFVAGNLSKGFSNEAFKFFEYNTLSVPLNIKYDFFVKNNWHLYAYSGGTIHMTAQAFHHIGTVTPSDENRDIPGSGERSDFIKELEKRLTNGIFQGGGFRENTYLSVNAGLGVEKYIGERWSVFTQSNYQHTMGYQKGGLGPFKDVIHTFSISTGLKVRVKR
jgi:hypothetical protein